MEATADMSIESMFTSRARVYRLSEATDSMRERVNTYVAQTAPTRANCHVSPPNGRTARTEAGNELASFPTVFGGKGWDVLRFDVLAITHGPETGRRFRVLDLSTPRNHHKELSVEPFTGRLPGDED
jgi:hypothetical protein